MKRGHRSVLIIFVVCVHCLEVSACQFVICLPKPEF